MAVEPPEASQRLIAGWREGDQVRSFALVVRKERRRDRDNKEYVDLELADVSGTIVAKIWPDRPAFRSQFDQFEFVAVEGMVRTHRGELQLPLDKCRLAIEEDRKRGFDEERLIPSTKEDIDALWRRLSSTYETEIERPLLKRLAADALAAHGSRLRLHPAAKSIHHAYRGGLLEHVVSMAELALALCEHYPDLDRDLMLLGVLFHDLGKLLELRPMPANDYTMEGRLVGHIVLGRDLLRERCDAIEGFPADLRLQLEHLILSHHGRREYGAAVEPMTAEAIALHFLDDLDSKLNQLRAARGEGGGLRYFRSFGRQMYLTEEE